MDMARLKFDAPRSDEARTLNALVGRRAELAATAREAENAPRVAAEEAQRASAELAALERRRLNGQGDATDAERTKLEKALVRARAAEAQPWGERVAGARAALRDADVEIQAHVAANYDTLAGEIADDAAAVKARADDLLRELGPAMREREEIVARFAAVIACVVDRTEPNLIVYTRLEPVVQAADSVLLSGGEALPVPRRDPREPRHGQAIAEVGW